MLDFKYIKDPKTGEKCLATDLSGKLLLTTPQLNKGTAFSAQEREEFGLIGKLPAQIETLEEQTERAYKQYQNYRGNLKKNIFLNNLLDNNHVLFYKLLSTHLTELIPKIYTPIVGTAVKEYNLEFRRPRGLYINYQDRGNIESILANRSNPDVSVIVVTDGEGVLGIGDQGVGAMDIPVAKLMVYTGAGGIHPNKTLPIMLDVGTNNEELLADPLYLGLRQPRVTGKDYDNFIEEFVAAIKKQFPWVFLHWEDFGRDNARRILKKYKDELCTFNDDMQGTGVVTLAALLSACTVTQQPLTEQRIVVFGAGTAGTGITEEIYQAMLHNGLSEEEARKRFWLIDRQGLLTDDLDSLTNGQKPFARSHREWQSSSNITLLDVVKKIKPTTLIGCSAVAGAFTEEIIKTMATHCERPIILPLSNPTERVEATPDDLLAWTNNQALIATGSPFKNVAQCNNALAFPGIGLGVITSQAARLSNDMLWAATQTLSQSAPVHEDPQAPILPSLAQSAEVTHAIALAVSQVAEKSGLAGKEHGAKLSQALRDNFWVPEYVPYKRLD